MGFVSPPLEEVCKDVIISYPPVTFGIDVENAEQSIPGFPIVSNSKFYLYEKLDHIPSSYNIVLMVHVVKGRQYKLTHRCRG